jgi:hypothetical protein
VAAAQAAVNGDGLSDPVKERRTRLLGGGLVACAVLVMYGLLESRLGPGTDRAHLLSLVLR